jgi:hypothetical protein
MSGGFPTQEAYSRWAAPMARSICVGIPNDLVFRYWGNDKNWSLRVEVNCVKLPKYTCSKDPKLLGAQRAAETEVVNLI